MKIALIHLSDFHIRENESFLKQKITGVLSSLNILGKIDDFAIVFSGDLANSGKINEYKNARNLLSQLINGIKAKNENKFVNLFMVPGNHDLCLPEQSRDRKYIQEHYNKGTIDTTIEQELKYLDNFYFYSNLNGREPSDKILNKRFCTYGNYKIQLNLINSAPFSTLEPNDKELHYFPEEKMYLLRKSDDANLCITVMHHSWDWFNWNYKSDLSKTIVDNSEMLFIGHDHRESTSVVSIDNSLDTWISAAGEMDFSSLNKEDSFNVFVIDTESNSFDGYVFNWDINEKIYIHKMVAHQKSLQNHSSRLSPLPSFIKNIKEDPYNSSDDFTKYFVFPKLVSKYKNEFGRQEELKNADELITFIENNKKVFITGTTNSGKTTLMKYLFILLSNNKVPLLMTIDNKTRIRKQNFIKHLFEEQYGESTALFERFKQLDKTKKVILIDGWDLLQEKNRDSIIPILENEFEFIVFGSSSKRSSIIDSIKEELSDNKPICELQIKPFFTEKRNQLVRNICIQKNAYNDEDINNVNRLIDALVHNNSSLFSLNPAFIIRYTNYFIQDPYHDYTKGEAVFSKIFEFELQQSIINLSKKSYVDEIFVTFEEIAGYMYTSRHDILQIEDIRNIVMQYNLNYGVQVNAKEIIDIGLNAKVFKQSEDLSIYFYNKNHLAYFIAKYLIRSAQSEPADISGIQYALENICFGINSDIILFISYLLNNTQNIMSIVSQAGKLLEPWTEISLDKKNIPLLHRIYDTQISAPSEDEQKKFNELKEYTEESHYSEDIIEAKGLFEYNDNEIDEYPYRLIRAIKYTEMICKVLASFNSSLKLNQKQDLIDSIYSYARKIIYAILNPIDTYSEELCNSLLLYIQKIGVTKKNGESYCQEDIFEMFNNYARAELLSIFDHFAEICTNSKTISLLTSKQTSDSSEKIQRLLIIENSGNTDIFLKEAESMIKENKSVDIEIMIKLVVRKHLLCNRDLTFRKKQQIIDRIFGKQARKLFMLSAM